MTENGNNGIDKGSKRSSSYEKYVSGEFYAPYDDKERNTTVGQLELRRRLSQSSSKQKSAAVSTSTRSLSSTTSKKKTTMTMKEFYASGGENGDYSSVSGKEEEDDEEINEFGETFAIRGAESLDEDDDQEGEDEEEEERLHLSEDVYAFIAVCPICSLIMVVSLCVVFVKYIIYGILISDIDNDGEYVHPDVNPLIQVVKFFLIPVAVTMQEDLMNVYANIANKRWDASVPATYKHATFPKFVLANALRCIDGLMSLTVNFYVMMCTNTILGIFLNFAALHFLQFIDDICYELIHKGFLGDKFEYATTQCSQVTFPRRIATPPLPSSSSEQEEEDGKNDDQGGTDDVSTAKYYTSSWNNFITGLDTFFMGATIAVCVLIYAAVQAVVYCETCTKFIEDTIGIELNNTGIDMFDNMVNAGEESKIVDPFEILIPSVDGRFDYEGWINNETMVPSSTMIEEVASAASF